MGGAVRAVEENFFQRLIEESAYNYQKEIEKGERIIVGVNLFRSEDKKTTGKFLKIEPEVQKKQLSRLKRFKKERELAPIRESLNRLKKAAQGEENLMPYIIEAVKNKATLGEISDALKEVWGTYSKGD